MAVTGEGAGLVDAGAARLVEIQVDRAAGAAVGEVKLCYVERSRRTRGRGEGVSGVLALELDRGGHRGAGGQRLGGHVVRERQEQAADRGAIGHQLDLPGAGQRRDEVTVTVASEGARLEDAGADRLIEVQVDRAVGTAIGEVEVSDLERDVLVRRAGEGVVDLLTGFRDDGLTGFPLAS